MTQLLSTLLPVLAWAAIPVTLVAVIDDWFLRPRRRLAQGRPDQPDPALMRGFYLLLPVVLRSSISASFSSSSWPPPGPSG